MDLKDPGEENVPVTRKKRRSSILKPPTSRAVLQDLETNVVREATVTTTNTKVKNRRVSFSRTQQVKEFMAGSDHATIWNSTYEEDHSHGASSLQAHTPNQPKKQGAIAGQSIEPLHINIPDANSPNKFLPTNPRLDTSNIFKTTEDSGENIDANSFLQSLKGDSAPGDESDDFYATNLDKTCRDSVTMARTMLDDSENNQTLEASQDGSRVDAGGFLAGLGGGLGGCTEQNDLVPHNRSVVTTETHQKTFHMDMTCKMEQTGMNITCNFDVTEKAEKLCSEVQENPETFPIEQHKTVPKETSSGNRSFVSGVSLDWDRDTVFLEEIDRQADQLAAPGSGNSSFDGGATATMKLTGLALANNTLMLPKRQSQDDEDDDMTRVPVQTFRYNAEEPVVNPENVTDKARATPDTNKMDMTNRTLAFSTDMDITRASNRTVAAPSDMEMIRASNRTVAAPTDMEMTRASNRTVAAPSDMEMTRASNRTVAAPTDMDITKASNRTQAAPSDMEMTRASNRTLAAPSDMDLTRATNKTEVAPTDRDMTKTSNRTVAAPLDMEMTRTSNKTIAASLDMEMTRTSNKTVTAPSDMEMTRSCNKTAALIVANEVSKQHNVDEVSLKEKIEMDNLVQERFKSPNLSPEPTMMIGGMIQSARANKSMNFGDDFTNFLPQGESTRAVNFPIPKPAAARPNAQFDDCGEITSFVPGGESTRSVPREMMLAGQQGLPQFDYNEEVTSFAPQGFSTQKIDFRLPLPGEKQLASNEDAVVAATDAQNVAPVARVETAPKSPDMDITSFAPRGTSTQVIDFKLPQMPALESSKLTDMDITSFAPKGTSTQVIDFKLPKVQPHGMPKSPDLDDITSFAPRGTSTQVIDFKLPQVPIENIPKSPESKDITTFAPEIESTRAVNISLPCLNTASPENIELAGTTVQDHVEELKDDSYLLKKEDIVQENSNEKQDMNTIENVVLGSNCIPEEVSQAKQINNVETDHIQVQTDNGSLATEEIRGVVNSCVTNDPEEDEISEHEPLSTLKVNTQETIAKCIESPKHFSVQRAVPQTDENIVDSINESKNVEAEKNTEDIKSDSSKENISAESHQLKTDQLPELKRQANEKDSLEVSPTKMRKLAEGLPNFAEPREEMKRRKSTKVRKSELRKSIFSEHLNAFEDLKWWLDQKDRNSASDWVMRSFDVEHKYAIFTWFESTMRMIVKIGDKLEQSRSRKSLGRVVTHFTITSISLAQTDPQIMQDPALDLALRLVTRKFPGEMIISRCPNTHSLKSLLNEVSDVISHAISVYKCLKFVRKNFVTTITNNVVSVDFASPVLLASFSVRLDYSEGVGAAVSSLHISPHSWNSYDLSTIRKDLKNIHSKTEASKFLETVVTRIWSAIQQSESLVARQK